jgi:hypothetical protein
LFDFGDASADQLVGQVSTATAWAIAQHVNGLNHARFSI